MACMRVDTPLRSLPALEYDRIRKKLLTFANIKHRRVASEVVAGTEERGASTVRQQAESITAKSSRAASVMNMRDKIAFALGTTRSGMRLLRRKGRQ